MKKLFIVFCLGIIFFIYVPIQANATSGRLRANSITSCNGQTYGQHGDGHWHIAVQRGSYWYPSGGALSDNPCNNNINYTPTISKSSDISLKEVKIGETSLDISDNMYYSTKESKVSLNATTNDSKAKVEILGNYSNLSVGDNNITIKVIAEDSTTKEYKLNIYKLSSNTKATIKYEDKEIQFTYYKSETIKVKNSAIKLTVIPDDNKAKSNVKETYQLKNGNNKIGISIFAEDGTSQKYTINVYRESDNTKATIKYKKKKITFTNYKSDKITVKKKKITFDVLTDDNKAKSNVKKSYKLKNGNNKITITVTAENGKKQKYTINVYKKKGLFG